MMYAFISGSLQGLEIMIQRLIVPTLLHADKPQQKWAQKPGFRRRALYKEAASSTSCLTSIAMPMSARSYSGQIRRDSE
jgi:hypothetical protein